MNKEELHKNSEYEGVSISLSAEHEKFIPEISQCFDDKFLLEGNFYRFSMGELAMQVIIEVAKWVISNVAWDTIKFGIKKFFEKFPNGRATVRHEGIMFVVRPDNSVSPVVIPDLAFKYKHIQNIDDLIRYLQNQNQEKPNIVEGWKETTAEEYCLKVADGTHDSPKQSEEGKYLVTSKNLKDGRLDLSSSYKISLTDFDLVNKRSKVDKGDILVGMIGTVGEVCLVKNEPDFAIKNVGLFKCGDYEKSVFLYYFLRSSKGQEYIFSRLSGTTQKYITLGDLRKFPIVHPIVPSEQRAIADMLSSFDAKIELLREQNETLEKTAQTIFHEWFGRYSVESPEELPEGWKIRRLGEFIEVYRGYSYKGEFLVDDAETVMINLGSFKPNDEICNLKPYSGDYKERYILKSGDIVIANTDITQDRVILGMAKIVPELDDKIVIHTHHVFGVNFIQELSKYFLLYLTTSFEYRERVESFATGTTVLALPSDAIENLTFVYNEEVIKKFHEAVAPIIQKKFDNNSQIQSLSKIRDTLLPELMSGEVRVN